jgi:hypothetical protein
MVNFKVDRKQVCTGEELNNDILKHLYKTVMSKCSVKS